MPQLLKRLGSITPRCRRADPVRPFSDPFAASPDGASSPESKEREARSPTPKSKGVADQSPYVVCASPAGSAKKQRLSSSKEDQPCAALPMPLSPVSASSTSSKKKKKKQPRTVTASPGCAASSPGSSAKKPRTAAHELQPEPHTARRRLELGTDPKDAATPSKAANRSAMLEDDDMLGEEEEASQPQGLRATAGAELGRPPMVPLSGMEQASPEAPLGTESIPEHRPASARGSLDADTAPPAAPTSSHAPPAALAPRAPAQPRRPHTARPAAPRPPQALARASSALLSGAAKAASSAATALTPRRLMSPGRLMSPRRMISPGRVMTPRTNSNTSEQTSDLAQPPTAAQPSPETQQRNSRSWLPSPRPSSQRSKKSPAPVGHWAATAAAEATPRSTVSHVTDAAGVGPLDSSDGEEADADPLVQPMLSAVYGRPLTRDEIAAAVSVCPEVSWLAQCALMCPLPPGWKQCNGDGTDGAPPILYACELTGEINEQPPHLPRFSRLARLLMTSVQRPEDTAAAAAWLEREIQDSHSEAARMKESWTQSIDPARGVKFWHDPISRRSCWENPAAPAEFIACVAERLLATEAFAKLVSGVDSASPRMDSARSDAAMRRADSARRSRSRAHSATPRAPAASPSPPVAAAPQTTPGSARRGKKASRQTVSATEASTEASTFAPVAHEQRPDMPESKHRGRSKHLPSITGSQTPKAPMPKLKLSEVQQADSDDSDVPMAPATAPPKQSSAASSRDDAKAFKIFTPPGSPAKLAVDPKLQPTSQAPNGDAASALAGAAAALAVAAAAIASARGPDPHSANMPTPAHEATLLPSDANLQAEHGACSKANAEEALRLRSESEAQRKAEEHALLQSELKEAEARLKAEQEARQKAEEEVRRQAAEAAERKAEEEIRRKAEEEARRKAEEDARRKAEEEVRRQVEEQARQNAEEEARRRSEQEARLKAEEEARLKAVEDAHLKAVEDARLKAEAEARLKAEEEARLQAELNAQQRAKEAATEIKAEEEASQRKREAPPPPPPPPGSAGRWNGAPPPTPPVSTGRSNGAPPPPPPPSSAGRSNGAPPPPPPPAKKLTVPATPNMQTDALKVATPTKKVDAGLTSSPAKKLTVPAMPNMDASPARKPQTPRSKLTVPAMPSPAKLSPMPAPSAPVGLPRGMGAAASGGS